MDEVEFFAPWRLVAAFGDGTRMLFDGLTEEQARDAMEAAAGGGWDNACGSLTLSALRGRMARNTIRFA